MSKNLSILILAFISTFFESFLCEVNLLTIIKNEMPETMKVFSVGTALVTLSESSDHNVIADKLTNALNTKYGPQWFSLIGPIGLSSHLNAEPNTSLIFKYANIQIFVLKLQSSQTQTNTSNV